ncbi:MAG TPA: ATP-binding protein [Patescibacteria group bacterium]|nr:ATP-binding protein [Patescibacteria group bacterium]
MLVYRSITQLETDLKSRDVLISENLLPKLLDDLGDYYVYQYANYVSSVKKRLTEHPDLLSFRILNIDSQVIFETSEIETGKTAPSEPKVINDPAITQVIKTKETFQDVIVVNNERQIRIIAPYIDNFGTFRNLVEFRYSLREINEAITEIIISFILFLVTFTIIGVIMSIFFVNIITRPLIQLTTIAGKIAAGDLSQKANNNTQDEVGVLADAFNQMVTTLKQKIDQLHDEGIKLEASINSLSLGFIMVDRSHNILTINHTARQILCASPSSPLATVKDCTIQHIEDELKGVIDLKGYINLCFEKKKPIIINELKFENRFLKILITPIVTIGVIGAVILVDDITEAKVMERSKEEFFSIASHELRTPLTAIRGNTSMIQEFYSDKITDSELSDMIKDIHASSIRLIAIVNDFLDTSRLEMGKMEFRIEPFDIVKLAQDTIKEYMTTGSMKKLYLKIDPLPSSPIIVQGDKDKVKQVLINLVGNAIKFTDVGGITLQVIPDGQFIKVLVIDTGRGISPESQMLLFRKFQQAQDNILTRDTTKGTGLGLYISKLMMQGIGGKIKIESSTIGKGTTFSISIPLAIKSEATFINNQALTQAPASQTAPPSSQQPETSLQKPTQT